jgi:hypothetical protein
LSKLPKGEAWDRLVSQYRTMDEFNLKCFADMYGYKNVESFQRTMRKRGIKRVVPFSMNNAESQEPTVEYVAYPEIKLVPFPQPKTDRDEEDMGVVLADWHLAKITESYNLDIAKTRVTKLTESIMKIVSLHAPIRKLHLFVTGDVVQGENTHQGSVIGSTSCGALEQVYSHAIPIYTELLLSLNQGIPEVELYGVDGNHGRYDKTAPSKTNWDAFFYESLKMALIQQPKIHVYPPRWFYQLVNIRGFRFFIVHGDQVNVSNGIPLFALRRKMQEWYAYVDGFNYAYCHTPDTQVWYPDGSTSNISQVKVGAHLFDSYGNRNEVKETFKFNYDGDMVTIKVRGLPNKLTMTPEHPLFVRKRSPQWVACQSLVVGDHIKVTTPMSEFKKYDKDEDWCKLVGLYLAEGNVYENQLCFAYNKRETDLIDETTRILTRYYRCKVTIGKVGDNCTTVRITSAQACEDMVRAGGKGALNKKLDSNYMLMPLGKQIVILRHWLLGDGHKTKNTYQGYTISGILARQMLMISWRLGYHATMRIRRAKGMHKQSYIVNIPMRDWDNNKWRKHSARNLWFRIIDIKNTHYKGYVYNLGMSHKTKTEPSYCAEGIASHNTGHFHSKSADQVNSRADYTICPPLVTGDEWALEKVGRASEPKQLCFGIHNTYGRTFTYDLICDKNYLPRKYDEPEGVVDLRL